MPSAGDGWVQTHGFNMNVDFIPLSSERSNLISSSQTSDYQQWECTVIATVTTEVVARMVVDSGFSEAKTEILIGNVTIYEGGFHERKNVVRLEGGIPQTAIARIWISTQTLLNLKARLHVSVEMRSLWSDTSHISACIFNQREIPNWYYSTTVLVTPALPLKISSAYTGSGFLTVGETADIEVNAFDAYGNVVKMEDLAQRLKVRIETGTQNSVLTPLPLQYPSNLAIVQTLSGVYNVHVLSINSVGLYATYYALDDFTQPTSSKAADALDFSLQDGGLLAWSLQPGAPFSVRWAGFIRLPLPQIYTLYADVSESDEQIRAWIGDSLVVDMWQNLSGTEGSGTFRFSTDDMYYDIKVEYRQLNGSAAARLSWAWAGIEHRQILLSTDFASAEESCGSPIVLSYVADTRSIDHLNIIGGALTIATCCTQNMFTIQGRDHYGNPVPLSEENVRVRLYPLNFSGQMLTSRRPYAMGELGQSCFDSDMPICQVSYKVKASGHYLLSLTVLSRNDFEGYSWQNVAGTPLELLVVAGQPKVFHAQGAGVSVTTAGVISYIMIAAKDCGDNKALIVDSAPVTLSLSFDMQDWQYLPFQSNTTEYGQLLVGYTATSSGAYFLSLRFYGLNIEESPFLVQCFPGNMLPHNSILNMPSPIASAGLGSFFFSRFAHLTNASDFHQAYRSSFP